MRLTKKTFWLTALFCCMASAIYYGYRSVDAPESSAMRTSAKLQQSSKPLSEEAVLVIPRSKEPAPSAPQQPASLSEEMQHARDFRVLYFKALQRINEGGGFYAINILMQCWAIRNNPDSIFIASRSPAQARARVLRDERCATFSDDELSSDKIGALSRDIRLQQDPLRRLNEDWTRLSQDPAMRSRVISAMLDTQDPLLLEKLAVSLFYTPSGSVHFNGKSYDQEYAMQIFANAWLGAICEATEGNCGGKDDFHLVDACGMHDVCGTSRAAALAADVARRFDEGGVALYQQIFPALVEAIKTRDSQAFRLP